MNQSHTSSSHRSHHQHSHQNRSLYNGDQSGQIEQQIRSIQDQIEFTICNYQAILNTEKKNTADRNEFLLYLIQSMKEKQNAQLKKYTAQLQNIEREKEQAESLDAQMRNIGEGVDGIVHQGKKLKKINLSLQAQLREQGMREKQLDEEIQSRTQEINELRQRVDEWDRTKLKWNRKKKDMIQLIDNAQNQVQRCQASSENTCPETGIQEENCDHCQGNKMNKLLTKYQRNGPTK